MTRPRARNGANSLGEVALEAVEVVSTRVRLRGGSGRSSSTFSTRDSAAIEVDVAPVSVNESVVAGWCTARVRAKKCDYVNI